MKGFIKFLLWVVFLVVLVVIILWVAKAPILSSYLSKELKTKVSVGSMSISKNEMRISHFSIKNPTAGVKDAFLAKEIVAEYQWDQLKADPSVIDRIEMMDTYLGIDCSNAICTKNNWTQILSGIEEKKSKEKKEVIVRKLILKNFDVEIIGLGINAHSKKKLHFDHMELNNFSSKEGFPMQEIIFEIFKNSGLQDYIKDFLEMKPDIRNLFNW